MNIILKDADMCSIMVNRVIDGIYNYIVSVYGRDRVPKYLAEAYQKAKDKRSTCSAHATTANSDIKDGIIDISNLIFCHRLLSSEVV